MLKARIHRIFMMCILAMKYDNRFLFDCHAFFNKYRSYKRFAQSFQQMYI